MKLSITFLCVPLFATMARSDESRSPHFLREYIVKDRIANEPVLALRFAADGKTLHVISGNEAVVTWDVATGRRLHGVQDMYINAATFASGGALAALHDRENIRLWDVKRGKSVKSIPRNAFINTLALSPDEKILATGSDDHLIELLETATGNTVHTCKGHDAYVTALAFSPNSKLLASGAHDRTIRLWDPTTGKQVHVLEGHTDQVSCLVFFNEGKSLASGSWDHTIRLWDVETGKEKHCLKGHRLAVTAVDVQGQRLASVSLDGSARRWDLTKGKVINFIEVNKDGLRAVALSPDGKVLAAGDDDEITTLWDAISGKRLHRLLSEENRRRDKLDTIHSIDLSPDGKQIVTGSDDGGIRLWDVADGEMQRLGRQSGIVWSVQFSPDGRYVASAGRRDGTVHLWDTIKGEKIAGLTGQKGGISRVLWSRDGKRIIAAGGSFDPAIYVWDVEKRRAIHRLEGHKDYIDGIALSWDDRTLASVSRDQTLRLWDLTTGKAKDMSFNDRWSCVAFSPDDTLLIAGDTLGKVTWRQLPSGKEIRQTQDRQQPLVHVGFLRDGRTLIAGGGPTFTYWETVTGRNRAGSGHDNMSAYSLAFEPRGRLVVTGGSQARIMLWDPTGMKGERGKELPLDATELDRRRQNLSMEPDQAWEAIWRLSATPKQSLPLFEKVLKPAEQVDTKQIERLVAELGSDRFRTRDAAAKELEKLGDLASEPLKRGLKDADPLDHRRRIERLLSHIESLASSTDTLRQIRMIEALEVIGTPEARKLLEKLAAGNPDARLTREAKQTLARLQKK